MVFLFLFFGITVTRRYNFEQLTKKWTDSTVIHIIFFWTPTQYYATHGYTHANIRYNNLRNVCNRKHVKNLNDQSCLNTDDLKMTLKWPRIRVNNLKILKILA